MGVWHTGRAVDVRVTALLGRVASGGQSGPMPTACLPWWLENCCRYGNLLPYVTFSYVLRKTGYARTRTCGCQLCIPTGADAVAREARGLIGAPPSGSEGPRLNFGASSVPLGSCSNPSELQFCTLTTLGLTRVVGLK